MPLCDLLICECQLEKANREARDSGRGRIYLSTVDSIDVEMLRKLCYVNVRFHQNMGVEAQLTRMRPSHHERTMMHEKS